MKIGDEVSWLNRKKKLSYGRINGFNAKTNMVDVLYDIDHKFNRNISVEADRIVSVDGKEITDVHQLWNGIA